MTREAKVDGRRPDALNQPWRGLVAVGEVLLAAAAVVVGVLCWQRGIVRIQTPVQGGQRVLESTVHYGNWSSAAIGLVVLAAILVLDAIRQALLAVRTRQRPAPEIPADDEIPADESRADEASS